MRHLFVSQSDYANAGALMAKALRSVGDEARCIVPMPHVFDYPEQGEVWRDSRRWAAELPEILEWADCVTVVQSELPTVMGGHYPKPYENPVRNGYVARMKRIALTHGGGYYRAHHRVFRGVWGGRPELNICHTADLMFGYANEHLVLPPFNDDFIPAFEPHSGPLVVGHFPSRPKDKGTAAIHPLLTSLSTDLGFEYRFQNVDPGVKDRLPWERHVKRMARCDVIIDQIAPAVGGFPVGEWCSNAEEAAACGCIVVANSHRPQPYVYTYGYLPQIEIANTIEQLEDVIRRLAAKSRPEIEAMRARTRGWAWQTHALRPTGRLLQSLYSETPNAA